MCSKAPTPIAPAPVNALDGERPHAAPLRTLTAVNPRYRLTCKALSEKMLSPAKVPKGKCNDTGGDGALLRVSGTGLPRSPPLACHHLDED